MYEHPVCYKDKEQIFWKHTHTNSTKGQNTAINSKQQMYNLF